MKKDDPFTMSRQGLVSNSLETVLGETYIFVLKCVDSIHAPIVSIGLCHRKPKPRFLCVYITYTPDALHKQDEVFKAPTV